MGKRRNASGTTENYPTLYTGQQQDAARAFPRSHAFFLHTFWIVDTLQQPHGQDPSPDPNPQQTPNEASTAPRLLLPIPHTTITHSNYIFNCCALISPQPTITAYSCKPNQGKPAYLHKSCNEKYNDFTNKTWIRTRICDKHFVSRRIENDFLS